MPTQYARQTAVPCTLAELQQGEWVQNSGMLPSGVNTPRGFISRASVLGVLTGKQDASFIIEDGTGKAAARSFDAAQQFIANVGDIVHIIGRPREFNGERYVALEICRKLRNPSWVSYRKKELELMNKTRPIPQPPLTYESTVKPAANPLESIITKIRSLDTGTGVMIDDLLDTANDAESHIRTLLEEGEIFEIRPGRVKVLE